VLGVHPLHPENLLQSDLYVAIRASSAKEVDSLIADLSGPDPVAREAAIARLTVIGSRAVERLLRVLRSSTESVARVSALRALEGIRDPRSLGQSLEAATDQDAAVAVAAIAVARSFLNDEKGTIVVEQLTKLVLDAQRAESVRLAAIAALKDLEPATVAPLLKALTEDVNPAIRTEAVRPALKRQAAAPHSTAVPAAEALLARASEDGLPDNPDQLREALASATRTPALAALLRIVERVRDREAEEPARRREKWTAVRAAAHLALARRHSRIALYDLREWLDTWKTPLPVDALAALSLIGDASCLEPIANRYRTPQDEWSKLRLADMFRAIVEREGVSRRHPAIKRVERKQKQTLDELWPAGDARKRARRTR
jgi:HEAT repeat protein